MKNLIMMLVLAFTGSGLFSNNPVEPQNHQVIAFSGLKLRAEPNTSGKVLKIIPFGQSVEMLETEIKRQSIEWLSGHWVKVRFEGKTGYVFDAFLTELPIPKNDYELSRNDADISYPLLSWMEHNFKLVSKSDTLETNEYFKRTQYFQDSITVSTTEGQYAFELTVDLPGLRLGDAYNISRSLLLTKLERELFEENTLFVSNSDGIIDEIKVDLDAPIRITKTDDGVSINVRSYQYICGL